MLQHIFFYSFVHVPECAHCTPSFSALYMLRNVLIVLLYYTYHEVQFCLCFTQAKDGSYHDYLVSTTHILFFRCHVVLCHCPQLFPIYCYFMSTIPPQQTGAVKTLPRHTSISLVLSFFFLFFFLPMNSQFNFFVLTKFLFSFNNINLICMPYSSLCSCSFSFCFSLYIFSKHHHHTKNWYSPTTNIIDYLDPGTMPQQNSTVILSTTVLETVSSSQLTNHSFTPG